jgi:hypothetical protein
MTMVAPMYKNGGIGLVSACRQYNILQCNTSFKAYPWQAMNCCCKMIGDWLHSIYLFLRSITWWVDAEVHRNSG